MNINYSNILSKIRTYLDDLFLQGDYNIMEFQSELYNLSLNIQKTKNENIRHFIIEFYHSVIKLVESKLEDLNYKLLDKIIYVSEENNIINKYNQEYNKYESNLKKTANLFAYFNTELLRLDKDFKQIDFFTIGKKLWFSKITQLVIVKIIDFVIPYFNNNYEENEENDNIYNIYEILDCIYYHIDSKIIETTHISDYIRNRILTNLEEKCVLLNKTLDTLEINNIIIEINIFNDFTLKTLSMLNLEFLNNEYKSILYSSVLINYKYRIMSNFRRNFDFNNFKKTYSLNCENLDIINYTIDLCSDDIDFLEDEYIKYITQQFNIVDNTDSYNYFIDIITLCYYIKLLYNDINEELDILSCYDIFDTYFSDTKNIIDNLDIYMKKVVYKNESEIPYNMVYTLLLYLFNKYNQNESLFTRYKNTLVKRFYKYNFSLEFIRQDINIIDSISKLYYYPSLHKIRTISNDIIESHKITQEFNKIYNCYSQITFMTDGLWSIHPKPLDYSNKIFSRELSGVKKNINTYYGCLYDGRVLKWNDEISKCILKYNISDTKSIYIDCSYNYANQLFYFNENIEVSIPSSLSKILLKYKVIKKSNDKFILNNAIKEKDININHNIVKKKKIKENQKKELAFSIKETLELFIVRTLKKEKQLDKTDLYSKINEYCKTDTDCIDSVLNKLINNDYLSKENNIYLYIP